MTGRELVKKVLRHESVERFPRTLWTIPYMEMFRKDELDLFNARYPGDIIHAGGIQYGKSHYFKGTPNVRGSYTDDFGCEFHSAEDGVCGEVKQWPIQTMADLDRYEMPWEILDSADCGGQASWYQSTGKYVLAGTLTRPFERM